MAVCKTEQGEYRLKRAELKKRLIEIIDMRVMEILESEGLVEKKRSSATDSETSDWIIYGLSSIEEAHWRRELKQGPTFDNVVKAEIKQ